MKVISSNKKGYFNFDVLDRFEAGIILEGWEVKSAKGGRLSLDAAYIKIVNLEPYLLNSSIARWGRGANFKEQNVERERKLLLKKNQIVLMENEIKKAGVTVVPLEAYINDKGVIKLEVGIVKGKKKFDKRQKLKEKDIERRIQVEIKKFKS